MDSKISRMFVDSSDAIADGGANVHATATQLAECIETLAAAGFSETADLVRIAHLDLVCALHDISNQELEALVEVMHCG